MVYTFAPIYNNNSRVLILGTAPSVRSLELGQFYGHPQNRFWRVMFSLFEEEFTTDYEMRKALILRHGLALWDTIFSCEREGSMDGDIKNAVPSDIAALVNKLPIRAIALNGNTARTIFVKAKYRFDKTPDLLFLPSTSPANARTRLEQLIEAYAVIKKYL